MKICCSVAAYGNEQYIYVIIKNGSLHCSFLIAFGSCDSNEIYDNTAAARHTKVLQLFVAHTHSGRGSLH